VRQKEALDGAVEHDDLDLLVGLQRGDDLIKLRNRLRAEDIDRRDIKCDAPIRRQASFKPDLTNGRTFFQTVHRELP
jgi:hypothetical protein